MSTIINNPPKQTNEDGLGFGLFIGIIFAATAGLLFFIYILPMLQSEPQNVTPTQEVEVQLPSVTVTE